MSLEDFQNALVELGMTPWDVYEVECIYCCLVNIGLEADEARKRALNAAITPAQKLRLAIR